MVRSRPRRDGALVTDLAIAGAYSATGVAWQPGPGRIYDRLAEELVARCPVSLAGESVLDIGAGTGAATRAVRRRGGDAVAVDIAVGMLKAGGDGHVPAVLGDALALPFGRGAFGASIAAFSLNHLLDPAAGLREAARVVRRGGAVVAGSYAADDTHPAKAVVDTAAAARGWTAPSWMAEVRRNAVPRLATVERATKAARDAGLEGAVVEQFAVPFPELDVADLVAWRLGMPHLASFLEQLAPADRAALEADAVECLSDAPVLVRSVIVLTSRV